MRSFLLILFVTLFIYSCRTNDSEQFTLINTAHLDHLYKEVSFNDRQVAIIHIYAEYPEYNYKDAPGEGIACIDDVARAAVFYIRHYQYTKQTASLLKAEKLIRFIIEMQSGNGFFYNFIFKDLTINSTHRNSEARADWWTWRALWALAEALPVLKENNSDLAQETESIINKTLKAAMILKENYPRKVDFMEIQLPGWLPMKFAADQAAVLIKGLVPYYQYSSDSDAKELIQMMADGIVLMQVGDSTHFPFNAILSWKNLWHAYGNSQSYALIEAGNVLSNEKYISAAFKEINHFYPFLIKSEYLNYFTLELDKDQFQRVEQKQFEQIAYNIRPMVFAALGAYSLTGEEAYSKLATDAACWLLGKNISGQALYDPNTGRCFDGIISKNAINFNSGAESTIEALLALLEIEKHLTAKKIVHNFYKKKK